MDKNELLIPNQIIKSKRKSISLIIKANGEFIIRAPIRAKDVDILRFVNQKADWIIKKRTEQFNSAFKPISFYENEQIMILGKHYRLKFIDTAKVKFQEDKLILPENNAKEKLIAFLKKYARHYITERVNVISQLFNFNYKSISITSAKTCWGSCSYSNKLHFTYKLIMCPPDVIDYIVLHELCHTRVKNHSYEFWALVEKCNPNYKTYEKWLKTNRGVIELI